MLIMSLKSPVLHPGLLEAAATAAAILALVGELPLCPPPPEDSDFIDDAVPADMGEAAAEEPMAE